MLSGSDGPVGTFLEHSLAVKDDDLHWDDVEVSSSNDWWNHLLDLALSMNARALWHDVVETNPTFDVDVREFRALNPRYPGTRARTEEARASVFHRVDAVLSAEPPKNGFVYVAYENSGSHVGSVHYVGQSEDGKRIKNLDGHSKLHQALCQSSKLGIAYVPRGGRAARERLEACAIDVSVYWASIRDREAQLGQQPYVEHAYQVALGGLAQPGDYLPTYNAKSDRGRLPVTGPGTDALGLVATNYDRLADEFRRAATRKVISSRSAASQKQWRRGARKSRMRKRKAVTRK